MPPDSSTDPPLRIDWIDAGRFTDGRPGRLGLTFLPGKHGPSLRYPGVIYRRELDADLVTLRAAGVRNLLLLVEDAELERWGDPGITERAAAAGIHVERRPIVDGEPPASLDELMSILAWLRGARAAGDVAIACMGGVGRTGTIAACALVEVGVDPDDAIWLIRRLRHPTAVETEAQVRFVHDFASARSSAGR